LRLLGDVSGRPELTLEQALVDAERLAQPAEQRLSIKDAGRILRVPLEEILWIDAAGDYMCVHTAKETHVLRATMRELEGRLDARRFQRIHRSTIVNVARVKELRAHLNGEYFLILDSGQQLKLSRSYKEKVRLLH
jgi:two-component system LytT family response regulator